MSAVAEQQSDAVDMTDLTKFQTEILYVLARDGPTYGIGIRDALSDRYGEDVGHSRTYPNLDQLVEDGLVAKSERDKRTNDYQLTERGRYLVRQDAQRRQAIAETLKNGNGGEQ